MPTLQSEPAPVLVDRSERHLSMLDVHGQSQTMPEPVQYQLLVSTTNFVSTTI